MGLQPQRTGSGLRFDLNRRSVRHQLPDLIYLSICDRDASVGPVRCPVRCSQRPHAVWEPVNHDVATGRMSFFLSPTAVMLVGIRNVDGLVKPAVRIAPVEDVMAFGSLVIPLLFLCADRSASERHFVGADYLSVRQQIWSSLAL